MLSATLPDEALFDDLLAPGATFASKPRPKPASAA
jgi:hypothetical protein